MSKINTYTTKISSKTISFLKEILIQKSFQFKELPHGFFEARHPEKKVVVKAYRSEKVLIQGKGTEEFVRYILEPEVLKTFSLGYQGNEFEPKIGMDEAGKGDFFGPLVTACVEVDQKSAAILKKEGVRDSKALSDRAIHSLAIAVKKHCGHQVLCLMPEKYNDLYARFKNLNHLLAWSHAACLQNLLEKGVSVKKALLDQFSKQNLTEYYLKKKGIDFPLHQKTKAESDMAVAAASLLARDRFVNAIDSMGQEWKCVFPKGAGKPVDSAGKVLLNGHGKEIFKKTAKLHFKNLQKITGN